MAAVMLPSVLLTQGLCGLGAGQHTGGIAVSMPVCSPRPNLLGGTVQPLDAREPTCLIEKVVARYRNGLDTFTRPRGAASRGAGRSMRGWEIVGVDALVHNGGGGVMIPDSKHGHTCSQGLEG